MKTHKTKYSKIETCRNCQGTGFVKGGYNSQVAPVCNICGGSGNVNKTIDVTITIEPA